MAQIIDGHMPVTLYFGGKCVSQCYERSWQRRNKMQNLKPLCDGAPITAESSCFVQSHAAST